MRIDLQCAIYGIGFAQAGVLIASALAPVHLRWRTILAPLPPLVRQLFWVYGGYVVFCIVSLAAVCVAFPGELASGEPLARAVCGFGALFWGVRLSLQPVLAASPHLTSPPLRLGYHALSVVFLAATVVFAWGAAGGL